MNNNESSNGSENNEATSTTVEKKSTGATPKKKEVKEVKQVKLTDCKPWTKLLKSTQHLEEKDRLLALGEKFMETYIENKRCTSSIDQFRKERERIQRENSHFKLEHNKLILTKTKLENLCRELQRQNKQIREENTARIREEELRRKETTAEMNEKLNDISSMMENASINTQDLHEENMDMKRKILELNGVLKQRGDHLDEMKREIDLQKQLSNAIVAKLETEKKLEKECYEAEKLNFLQNLAIKDENTKKLQEKLNEYQDRYKGIEETMVKSNQIFTKFKNDFETMSNKIKTLEKESSEWKIKFYGSTNAVVKLTETNEQQRREILHQQAKIDRLETLCRRLQSERTIYLKELKDNNITIPEIPAEPEPPRPVSPPKKVDGPTAKEKQLEEMKKQLAELKLCNNEASTSGQPKSKKNKTKKKTEKDQNADTSKNDIPEKDN